MKSSGNKENLKTITIHIPYAYLKELDKLVEIGKFPSRSEAIRVAVRDLLMLHKKELKGKLFS